MIQDRIARFVQSSTPSESFEDLALAAFAFQFERIEPYRRLCEGRGVTPATVTDWRQVPPVPTVAFKTLELAAVTIPDDLWSELDQHTPARDLWLD